MTPDLLKKLEESFSRRSGNPSLRLNAWRETAGTFPPVIEKYSRDDDFPSTRIALHAGDLGLALLWIVQAALVDPLTRDSILPDPARQMIGALIPGKGGLSIIALAHSEDPRNPVVIHDTGGKYLINGTKKYITGGILCDFILITLRRKGEEKISHMACLPAKILPAGSLAELDINALRTTSHARLNLNFFPLSPEFVVPAEGPVIRKLIKKWGLIERALILEAYIAFGMYISSGLAGIPDVDPSIRAGLEVLLKEQKAACRRQLAQALSGEMVEQSSIDLNALLACITSLKDTLSGRSAQLPESLISRRADLDLFSLLRM